MTCQKLLSITTISSLLCACVVKPVTVTEYDEVCQIETRSVVLEMHEVGGFGVIHCSGNQDCKAALIGQAVGAALVLPLSAIISGTIALGSNSYYHLKEQAACAQTPPQESQAESPEAMDTPGQTRKETAA